MSNNPEGVSSVSALPRQRAFCASVLGTSFPTPTLGRFQGQAQAMLPEAATYALGHAPLREASLPAQPTAHVFLPHDLYASPGLLAPGARGRITSELDALLGLRGDLPDRLAALLARDRRVTGTTRSSGSGNPLWRSVIRCSRRFGGIAFATPGRCDAGNSTVLRREHSRRLTPGRCEQFGAGLVVVCAIHFAGEWDGRFPPQDALPAPFRRLDGDLNPVPTTCAELGASHGTDGVGHAVRLSCRDGGLALWAAATRRSEEAAVPLAALGTFGTAVEARLPTLRPERVAVCSSKSTFSAGGDTMPELKGAGSARPPGGCLGGILSRLVRPDGILHRSHIRFDENGTVATAAAGVATRCTQPLERFSADRSFAFVLMFGESRCPLFMRYVGDAATLA